MTCSLLRGPCSRAGSGPNAAVLMIFADYVKELARRHIIGGRLRTTVRHVKPVNKGKTQRIGSLNDTAAHGERR